ncbi:EAL domain-containing protein [Amphritea balenae]|uniref:EAL domain-containing protein n=1 Tax=Amphritea balenae TaxID=452629 RepID=A0A3P1SND7_9GAMM|nr:EAL domain-containing protein [Amphritea balenae]RRC98668.1 EAL domain-containing protein [Amphritea balenae]GGK66424.1 hypothetical protein GCM10007941_15780 [Amphritea balenae]
MALISPIVRLTLGLLLLTISLLLVGDLIGLVPDKQENQFKARVAIAETLAVQVSIDVAAGHIDESEQAMRLVQNRSEDIVSLGLRNKSQQLIFATGEHAKNWRSPANNRSTYSHLLLPIHDNAGRWGTLEIQFKSVDNFWGGLFQRQSIIGIILFVSVAGCLAYWLFLKRSLRELDPSSVVPDRVKNALDTLSEGLVILDQSGHILFTNSTFIRKTGFIGHDLTGIPLSTLAWNIANVSDDPSFVFPWKRLLTDHDDVETTPLSFTTKAKELLSFSVNVARIDDPKGNLVGAIVTFADLTELEQSHQDLARVLQKLKLSQTEIAKQNKELRQLASYDSLTGILNRRSLFEGLDLLINETREERGIFSCIMVDIDHFKLVNDRYGHATGDKAIKLMALTLTKMTRPEDLVGRYGGEEFCVVLKGMSKMHALEIAERIRRAVEDAEIRVGSSRLNFTASFGVSSYERGEVHAEEIIDKADKALYVAKETGRNKVVHWQDKQSSTDKQHEMPDLTNANVMRTEEGPKGQEMFLLARIEELENQLGEQRQRKHGKGIDKDGSASRAILLDRIQQNVIRFERTKTRMALLFMGTETITQVRSTWGYQAAEKLTRMTIKRLRTSLRSTDTVSRDDQPLLDISISKLSQNEFALLLTDIQSDEDITWIVQRLLSALKEPFILEGNDILVVPNFGVSSYPEDSDDPEILLANASAALLEARMLGQDNCIHFSEDIHKRSRKQLNLSANLQKAIKHDDLFMEYLPQIDIRNGRITGFEALLRWYHPELGMVDPAQFIALAERSGLISDIGRWVLNVACRQLKQWQSIPGQQGLTITVNFSQSQFNDTGLVDDILTAVKSADIACEHLVIDLTESSLSGNEARIVDTLQCLSDAGIRFALDDFGTGRSSLASLRDFSLDWVKIDRSFVSGFERNPLDTEIVTTVISMAHNLGLKVVAEGVADMKQLATLKKMNCDEVQGELFSKPLLKDQATRYLEDKTHIKDILQIGNRDYLNTSEPEENGLEGILNNADGATLVNFK